MNKDTIHHPDSYGKCCYCSQTAGSDGLCSSCWSKSRLLGRSEEIVIFKEEHVDISGRKYEVTIQ